MGQECRWPESAAGGDMLRRRRGFIVLQVRLSNAAGPQKLSGLRHYFSLIALLRRRLAKKRGPATLLSLTCNILDSLLCLRNSKTTPHPGIMNFFRMGSRKVKWRPEISKIFQMRRTVIQPGRRLRPGPAYHRGAHRHGR